MEVHTLKLTLTDQDLNALLRKHLPPDQPIEDLQLVIDSQGLTIAGVYPLFLQVRFETRWELGVAGGLIAAQLANFKAMGVPGNIFKSAIVKIIEDLARNQPWIRAHEDSLLLDVDAAIGLHAFPARTHLTAIQCEPGCITIMAGE
ncbi:MAG: hypothetical protein HY040_25530 [Planctomycetes bacterium]|nr:hypothetical protein [Planctomycetota bacterium]